MPDPFPCPKCGDLLAPSGELEADGQVLPVYQCDSCTMQVDFGGEMIESALTFARKPDGTIVDAADPDRTLRF
jgi:DNA-directed RNA polymerase subunit M/transcription elongation factor TFIIS